MADRLDLPRRHWEELAALLREHAPDAEVWAYGSRVNGRSHDGSDLDLVLRSPTLEPLGHEYLKLVEALEQSNIPILVQAHDWARLPETSRREIERDYVVVQEKQPKSTSIGYDTWTQVSMGDIVDIKHGFAFKGDHIHDEPRGDVLLTPGNFAVGGGFKGEKFKYYDGLVPGEFVLSKGDLLVTMTDLSKLSDTLGYPALVPNRTGERRYLHNQRLGKVFLKRTEEVDTKFLYYVMCTADYRHEVLASATGTTVKHTSPDRIKQFRFMLPPLPEQRAIAGILGVLDDKIELNRRMNETLEQMARALFQSWFVDFDPVRAKMAGREPSLPPELWALFPDRLVDSELGEIPEGWEVKTIGDVTEVVGGTTPSTKVAGYWDEGIHCWATPKDLSRLSVPVLLDTERKITDSGLKRIGSGLQPKGTVLLSSRAPIGYLAINEVPVAINQGFIAIKPRKGVSNLLLLYWCKSSLDEIVSHANGSTFLEISKSNFRQIPLVIPTLPVSDAYDSLASNLYDRIVVNERSSLALATQRDALLPKLVSGEIAVDERRG